MTDKFKQHKAGFTTLFLSMSNALGGSPMSLLNNQDATDLILKAQDDLTQMLLIAADCHDVEMDFQEDYDSHLTEEIDKLNGDIKLLTTDKETLQNEVEALKAENAKLKKSKPKEDKKETGKSNDKPDTEQPSEQQEDAKS